MGYSPWSRKESDMTERQLARMDIGDNIINLARDKKKKQALENELLGKVK